MEREELIKALQWCGSEDERHEMCVDESYRCPMWNEDRITDECKAELMTIAADALEAAEQRIAIVEEERDLERFAAKNYLDKIDELKALMPKEGEWKKILQNGDGTSDYQCSACLGIIENVPDDDEHPLCSFCPNCGARMK